MSNKLWTAATSKKGLLAGWHLARSETRRGFFFDFLHEQAIAQNLDAQIDEIRRLLETRSYKFRPIRQVPIPKSSLSTRPGSYVPLRDRIVLWAIVRKIAMIFDSRLHEGVYSYRIKKSPKEGELFREGDILDIPFLKSQEIRSQLDPFQPWYARWPDFEKRTKEIIDLDYVYLSVSDISGYFENINIDILKDQIISCLDNEPILSNFISNGLADWVNTSQFGYRPRRGIPQGTGISSFFGNIYLTPIDSAFRNFQKKVDIKYIRYMDDIRIFSKDLATAREAIFLLENEVRDLHLNLQSSKTKILYETPRNRQITNSLFDDRVELISHLSEKFEKGEISSEKIVESLYNVARKEPLNKNSKKLLNVGEDKNSLTDRAMRMWMNSCIHHGSHDYFSTLFKQIYINPDQRISTIYVNSCITFPRVRSLGDHIMKFIKSEYNIHPYQEAELIKSARYLSHIDDEIWRYALSNVNNLKLSFQLRIQSLLLLGMRSHKASIIDNIFSTMRKDGDIANHPYYMAVLGQVDGVLKEEVINYYSYHANQQNQEFGLFLKKMDTNITLCKRFLEHVFGSDREIIDYMGILYFISVANNYRNRDYLRKLARARIKGGGKIVLLNRLRIIVKRIDNLGG